MPIIFGGIVGLFLIVLWFYAIFDVITTDSNHCRNLPKLVWLLFVIILPEIGSITWLLLGRPHKTYRSFPTRSKADYRPAPLGIEDRDDWPDAARKLLGQEPTLSSDNEGIEKQKIRDAADERARRLREWESRLIQREKQIDDREREIHKPLDPDQPNAE